MQHTTARLNRTPLGRGNRKALWLGLASGLFARLVPGRLRPVVREDLKNHDYPVSMQRIGVRFTERIRDTFRFRWVRRML